MAREMRRGRVLREVDDGQGGKWLVVGKRAGKGRTPSPETREQAEARELAELRAIADAADEPDPAPMAVAIESVQLQRALNRVAARRPPPAVRRDVVRRHAGGRR